eukprot:6212019-Pleurochrysis_carterae.AAC.1
MVLAVEEDGTALLILSSSASEDRAEKESVEFTRHSPAKPFPPTTSPDRADDEPCAALYDGPFWIEEMELFLDEARIPEKSLDVTVAVCNIPGNLSWQPKSTQVQAKP